MLCAARGVNKDGTFCHLGAWFLFGPSCPLARRGPLHSSSIHPSYFKSCQGKGICTMASEGAVNNVWYCWWKKSCITWDLQNLVNNGINYLSTGAGFLPSTVSFRKPMIFVHQIQFVSACSTNPGLLCVESFGCLLSSVWMIQLLYIIPC